MPKIIETSIKYMSKSEQFILTDSLFGNGSKFCNLNMKQWDMEIGEYVYILCNGVQICKETCALLLANSPTFSAQKSALIILIDNAWTVCSKTNPGIIVPAIDIDKWCRDDYLSFLTIPQSPPKTTATLNEKTLDTKFPIVKISKYQMSKNDQLPFVTLALTYDSNFIWTHIDVAGHCNFHFFQQKSKIKGIDENTKILALREEKEMSKILNAYIDKFKKKKSFYFVKDSVWIRFVGNIKNLFILDIYFDDIYMDWEEIELFCNNNNIKKLTTIFDNNRQLSCNFVNELNKFSIKNCNIDILIKNKKWATPPQPSNNFQYIVPGSKCWFPV